jgi:hypothetical protein
LDNPSPALPLKRGGKVIKNSPLFCKEGWGEIFGIIKIYGKF